jgi:hypothetical protein
VSYTRVPTSLRILGPVAPLLRSAIAQDTLAANTPAPAQIMRATSETRAPAPRPAQPMAVQRPTPQSILEQSGATGRNGQQS